MAKVEMKELSEGKDPDKGAANAIDTNVEKKDETEMTKDDDVKDEPKKDCRTRNSTAHRPDRRAGRDAAGVAC
jgi:hypothetical protein